jgi:hypothetical protein
MEAAKVPHLRVVDAHGEVQDVCEHCVAKDQAIERLTRSYEGSLNNLRQQLDDKRDDDKRWDWIVLEVTEDWCTRAAESGWWTHTPKPTEPRLADVRAALNRGLTGSYLILVNKGAFMSAATERGNPRFKRAWLEPATIYGKFIDAHYQTAIDPENKRVRAPFDVPKVLVDRWVVVERLAWPCDHCGHPLLEHDKASIANDMVEGECLVHGCHCTEFDDLDYRTERWKAEQDAKARRRS